MYRDDHIRDAMTKKKQEPVGVVCCRAPECCDMRGMLSFMILHLLSKKRMYGLEIAEEIAKRKADRPNPGTLYPTLRRLEKDGLVESTKEGNTRYFKITPAGRAGLELAKNFFVQAYGDIVLESIRENR
jgi:DNA-binding PadR family transcriptional regulator